MTTQKVTPDFNIEKNYIQTLLNNAKNIYPKIDFEDFKAILIADYLDYHEDRNYPMTFKQWVIKQIINTPKTKNKDHDHNCMAKWANEPCTCGAN